jgi:hypothetical protein
LNDLENFATRRQGTLVLIIRWTTLASASGSSSGKLEKKSRFPEVRVLLPDPFGPAMKVIVGFTSPF